MSEIKAAFAQALQDLPNAKLLDQMRRAIDLCGCTPRELERAINRK